MHVDDSDDFFRVVQHWKRRDLKVFHLVQCRCCELIRTGRRWVAGHERHGRFAKWIGLRIRSPFKDPPNVAIGEDSFEAAGIVADQHRAHVLLADHLYCFAELAIFCNDWNFGLDMHQVADF